MKVQCAHKEMRPVDVLTPHPRNPNKHPKSQIILLAKILNHQGWRNPVVISSRSGFVVSGHGRLEAARLNGWTHCPVDIQHFDNEADEYAHMVADNKIQEISKTDLSMVAHDILDLGPDLDTELLGMLNFTPTMEEKEVTFTSTEVNLGGVETFKHHCPNCGHEWNDDPEV